MGLTKVDDFEKSLYKFIKENYSDLHNFIVYYGDITYDIDLYDTVVHCNFSEVNVDTGSFSIASVEVVTRIDSVDDYNNELVSITDELRSLFVNSDINLYDFSTSIPQIVVGQKIIVQSQGIQVYESLQELEIDNFTMLMQIAKFEIRLKLLHNFIGGRSV